MVGSALGARLAPTHDLTFLDRAAPSSELPGAFVQADLRDLPAVEAAARGMDGVFHTAALHGIHRDTHSPEEFIGINVVGTFNVLEAAARQGVPKVVFSSTAGVHGGAL